jgi:ornithine decarboxylase
LLRDIAAAGCRSGLAFHVGSQCGAPASYTTALTLVGEVIARAAQMPAVIDVGGGFPAAYAGATVPPLEDYMRAIAQGLARLGLPASTQVIAEPGRALVADACSLLVRIQLRKDGALYLNDGVFGSLAEMALSSLRMPVRLIRPGVAAALERRPFTLYGPTCDGLDVLPGSFELPVDAREGDWLEIGQLGAYSNALATRFNGFYPETCVVIDA